MLCETHAHRFFKGFKRVASLQVVREHPDNRVAGDAVRRLTPVVAEQREKLKEEMMGAGPTPPPSLKTLSVVCCVGCSGPSMQKL